MKKNKTSKEIIDEVETRLQITDDKLYINVVEIDKSGRIYLPYIELLLYELVEFLSAYLGTQYFEDNCREKNIFSSVVSGIEEIKMNRSVDTVSLIENLKAAMNQSRYTFLGLLEFSMFNGLVFKVFDEFYTRYRQLLEYITMANSDYKKFFLYNQTAAQIYIHHESLLQAKIAEKKKEKTEVKQREEQLWKLRFSNLIISANQTSSKINSPIEKNDTLSTLIL